MGVGSSRGWVTGDRSEQKRDDDQGDSDADGPHHADAAARWRTR